MGALPDDQGKAGGGRIAPRLRPTSATVSAPSRWGPLQAGRRRKVEQGGYVGGQPPFGYRAEGRSLVSDDDEQVVLERIRELRAEGLSFRAIAARLNVEGVKPRASTSWYPGTVGPVVARLEGRAA